MSRIREKQSTGGVHIGASSILVIFVLLCLTTFATLSLVSANADHRLSRRTLQAAEEYYGADAKAEERLAHIDEVLRQAHQQDQGESSYMDLCFRALAGVEDIQLEKTAAGPELFYGVAAGETQQLQVRLLLLDPDQNQGRRFRRLSWQLVNTAPWVEENSITLWTPEKM